MKNIVTILKKELLRVFKDKKLVLSLLMPGVLIYVMYSSMGNSIASTDREAREATYNIATAMSEEEMSQIFDDKMLELLRLDATFTTINNDELDSKKEQLKTGEVDVVVVFSDRFIDHLNSNELKPTVTVYFNPHEGKSRYAYEKIAAGLETYRQAERFKIYGDTSLFDQVTEQIFDEKEAASKGFAKMIPFLIVTLLFAGCMAIAPDAIAGEKERGTIASILITPIKRTHLALGKVFALSILATLSALSSFLGLMLSLPKITGGTEIGTLYGASEYILILLILITTVLFIVSAMAIISSFAKTTKEANMLIMPFMFLSMMIGLISSLGDSAATNALIYLTPLYNSVQAMTAIFTFSVSSLNFTLAILSNIVYIALCIFILTKLFNNERVIFSK